MATGFNTEFKFNNRVYHVQTEDRGLSNPTIQTLIYVRGEMLDSFKSGYADLLASPTLNEGELLHRMEIQHKKVVFDIKNGKYDSTPNEQLLAEQSIFNGRPLDESILEHLEKDGGAETLELILTEPMLPKFGCNFEFNVKARLCVSRLPVPDADVSVKLVSSLKQTFVLATGKTDGMGGFGGSVMLPPNQPGHCAIQVSCASGCGNDEIGALITT